jgi:hypothetical protein
MVVDEGGAGMHTTRSVQGVDVRLDRALVGAVRAGEVHLERSAAGPVLSRGSVTMEYAGCGPLFATGDVSISRGGCGPLLTTGDVSIERGGTQSILAAGDVTLGTGAFAGVVLGRRIELREGSRVLMSRSQAAAFGVAVGAAAGVVSVLLRTRTRAG